MAPNSSPAPALEPGARRLLPAGDVDEVLRCFHAATVPAAALPVWYKFAIGAVALAMIILPAAYLALVAATGWFVAWYAVHGLEYVGDLSGKAMVLGYAGPLFVGGVLFVFLIKPLFARPPRPPQPVFVSREEEPAMWALVERICEAVGAPKPRRIAVDCQVNASASFEGGVLAFLAGRLRLTIGLPLATGLTLEQLAGVLAHEFGHFAQGGGMRLSFVIRSVSHWFARVVHERDAWDAHLIGLSEAGGWITIVGWIARGIVWLSRRVLWCLMWAGFVISSYLLRQMEFDADSYEARLAGSKVHADTSRRLVELSVGANRTWALVQQNFKAGRLPNDVPALVEACTRRLPREVREQISTGEAEAKSGLFDTHPTNRARVAAAERLAAPGIFHADAPAALLFRDLPGLARRATQHHYAVLGEIDLRKLQLVDNREVETKEDERVGQLERADAALQGMLHPGLPFELAEDPGEHTADRLARAETKLRESLAAAKTNLERFAAADSAVAAQVAAVELLSAGLAREAREIKPAAALRDSAAARDELERRRATRREAIDALAPTGAACAEFLAAAAAACLASASDEANRAGVLARWRLLREIRAFAPDFSGLRELVLGVTVLLGQMQNQKDPQDLIRAAGISTGLAEKRLAPALARFGRHACPFPEAPADANMQVFLDTTAEPDWHPMFAVYQRASGFVDRLAESHARLIGRLLSERGATEAPTPTAGEPLSAPDAAPVGA